MACTYVKSNSVETGAPYWPTGSTTQACPLMKSIQQALKDYGWYQGTVDGIPGTATARAIQSSLAEGSWRGWGVEDGAYTGGADGYLGYNSAVSLQKLAHMKAGYNGPIDGDPREASWTAYLAVVRGWVNAGLHL